MYRTAWTHIWIPALREVDLEPSAKRGANRTEALVSLYWLSRSLHPEGPQTINDEMCVVPVIDILSRNIASQRIKEALEWNQSDTGGIASVIKVKVNSSLTLTVNLDLSDRLVNGRLGKVKHISKDLNGEVTKIYIKFDNAGAGQKKINKDTFAK